MERVPTPSCSRCPYPLHQHNIEHAMKSPSLAVAVSFLRHFSLESAEHPTRPVNLMVRRIPATSTTLRGGVMRYCDDFLVFAQSVAWYVSDNGGEWNMERLNLGELPTSIPDSWHGFPLNEATMAMRMAAVIRGEPIDYDERMTDEDQATLIECNLARS